MDKAIRIQIQARNHTQSYYVPCDFRQEYDRLHVHVTTCIYIMLADISVTITNDNRLNTGVFKKIDLGL